MYIKEKKERKTPFCMPLQWSCPPPPKKKKRLRSENGTQEVQSQALPVFGPVAPRLQSDALILHGAQHQAPVLRPFERAVAFFGRSAAQGFAGNNRLTFIGGLLEKSMALVNGFQNPSKPAPSMLNHARLKRPPALTLWIPDQGPTSSDPLTLLKWAANHSTTQPAGNKRTPS